MDRGIANGASRELPTRPARLPIMVTSAVCGGSPFRRWRHAGNEGPPPTSLSQLEVTVPRSPSRLPPSSRHIARRTNSKTSQDRGPRARFRETPRRFCTRGSRREYCLAGDSVLYVRRQTRGSNIMQPPQKERDKKGSSPGSAISSMHEEYGICTTGFVHNVQILQCKIDLPGSPRARSRRVQRPGNRYVSNRFTARPSPGNFAADPSCNPPLAAVSELADRCVVKLFSCQPPR